MNGSRNPAADRRRFTRVPFDTRARITYLNNNVIEVSLLDLCLQGALVELPEDFQTSLSENKLANGDKIRLELFLDEDEISISMETEVVYIQGQHIGLRCCTLDLDSITYLRRLVELNIGDSDLFQQELVSLGKSKSN